MATVPLNIFVRASAALTTTYTQVYSAPTDTAGIMLTILASNVTNNVQTVTVGVSGNGGAFTSTLPYFDIVKNFEIPPYDTANLAIGKIVLNNYDGLYAYCSGLSTVSMTVSILETLNTTLE